MLSKVELLEAHLSHSAKRHVPDVDVAGTQSIVVRIEVRHVDIALDARESIDRLNAWHQIIANTLAVRLLLLLLDELLFGLLDQEVVLELVVASFHDRLIVVAKEPCDRQSLLLI